MIDGGVHQQPMIEESEFTLRDLLRIVYRRRWVVLLIFAPVLGVVLGLSVAAPPAYQAVTTVTIDKTLPVVLFDRSGELSLFSDQPAIEPPGAVTLAELVKSERVKDAAIARLVSRLGTERARTALSGLSVQPVRDTELVRITAEHTNPEIAAAAANAVADSLVDMSLKARRHRATGTRQFIEEQLDGAAEKLQGSEAALLAFKRSHGDISLSEETTLRLQKLAELETQRVDIRLPRREEFGPIAELNRQLDTLEIELSGLQRQFTSRHPAVLSTEAKIAEAKRRLEAASARHRQTDGKREQGIAAAIVRHEARLQGLPSRQAELARLTRDVRVAEEIYLLLSTKYQQARIAEASIGSGVQVVDSAKVPEVPAKSRGRRLRWLGALLGLMLGLGAALVIDQADRTVKLAEDVERALRAPVYGAIPRLEGESRGRNRQRDTEPPAVVFDSPSPASEAFQAVCTRLLASMTAASYRSLLVSSPLSADGKSTVAANLAVAFARTGRRTWLINGNLRNSGPQNLFPEADSRGLSAILRGEADLATVVRPTGQYDLCFISSGGPVPNAVELLSSPRLASFMNQARAQADVILVDSPAILAAPDAEVLGTHVDAALLVVCAGKTDRGALTQTSQRLERLGVRVAGGVLNRVPFKR